MNCKQGDLAIVTKPIGSPDVGKSLTCLEYVGGNTRVLYRGIEYHLIAKECWLTDCKLETSDHYPNNYCPDSYLMPITPPAEMKTTTKEKTHEHS